MNLVVPSRATMPRASILARAFVASFLVIPVPSAIWRAVFGPPERDSSTSFREGASHSGQAFPVALHWRPMPSSKRSSR